MATAGRSRTVRVLGVLVLSGVLSAAPATAALGDHEPVGQVTVMARNLYLGADVAVALDLLPDMPAAAQFMWEQVAATDFDTRVAMLAEEVVEHRPAVIGLQESTRWRCRGGNLGRLQDVYDFTAGFLAATREAGVPYVIAAADGARAEQPGYRIPALPWLSRVEDPATFQDRFGSDTATCGFDLADALLVREDLADRVVAAGGRAFSDRYAVVPTVLIIDRGYAWADLALEGGVVRFVTTHLESLWDEGVVPHGARQARQLLEDLAGTETPLVVLGDINSDPRDPRAAGVPNPALQPAASDACPGQVDDPVVATALGECSAYWTLRQGGLIDAGPDPMDGANHTWGSAGDLAGPDLARLGDALAMGNPAGFTDRLDYVLYRGDIEVVDARLIGHQWPDGPGLWACDGPTQVANTRAVGERLVEAGALSQVPDGGICLPTDHAGLVVTLALPDTGLAASPPPPERWRSPIGPWTAAGLVLLALVAWRLVRRWRPRQDSNLRRTV